MVAKAGSSATTRKNKKSARLALSIPLPNDPNRMKSTKARIDVIGIRKGLGLPRSLFARLSGYSERALAEWESGKAISASSRQRMVEMDRLRQGLVRVMKRGFIGDWLQIPNEAFGGLKPIEVVERGELDRIWQMIYLLESGQPD
jgi:DNA-binding transcriptional regulator YiaG